MSMIISTTTKPEYQIKLGQDELAILVNLIGRTSKEARANFGTDGELYLQFKYLYDDSRVGDYFDDLR